MKDLVEKTSDQCWCDLKLREKERQTSVSCFPQPQTLLVLLIDTVTAQHALKKLRAQKSCEKPIYTRAFQVFFRYPHLEDKFSETIRVFAVQQEGVTGISSSMFKQQQEELIPGRTALEEAEQQLKRSTQL